jgi:hypothetical protein
VESQLPQCLKALTRKRFSHDAANLKMLQQYVFQRSSDHL